MKRFWALLLAGLLMLTVSAPASAFEFGLRGTWLWGYDAIDQGGKAGFFGPQDFAALTTGGSPKFNTMNGFVGFRTINGVQYGMVTGTNASLQWMRMELFPSIKINQAVELRGVYQIGAGTTTEYGLYANSSSFGAYNPIAAGTWTQWGLRANTPWGMFVLGKRPTLFGIGLNRGDRNATSEQTTLSAGYGPLLIGIGVYPSRAAGWNSPTGSTGNTFGGTYNRQVLLTSPAGNFGPQLSQNSTSGILEYRLWDRDRARNLNGTVAVTYLAGSVEIGGRYDWQAVHANPAAYRLAANAVDALTFDNTYEDAAALFRFNNGRFFFNAEVAWIRAEQRTQNSLVPVVDPGDGGGHPLAPFSYEQWKYGVEFGAMGGPTKVSFLFTYFPGPDRRHGIWIKNQSWDLGGLGRSFSSASVFLPYSLLMGYQYGAGLNMLNRNGEGYMSDAITYAARLDYAVAANLNVYGTFVYANRQSKGWPWGVITLAGDAANGGGRAVVLGTQGKDASGPFNFAIIAPQNNFAAGAPNIPDDSLGWEATAGLDWKLLEGLTVGMRGAYWEVGNWFKYACVDKSLANFQYNPVSGFTGAVVANLLSPYIGGTAAGLPLAVNPNRAIDPIWMFQGLMVVDF